MNILEQDNLNRILVVDDNEVIHESLKKILSVKNNDSFDEDEAILFNDNIPLHTDAIQISMDSVYQGLDAVTKVQQSIDEKAPYAVAFVDILMPPGIDGIETIKQIWKIDPLIQVIICSAYSEYSWEDILAQLGESENFIILKKPFEVIEINQLVTALTKKWYLRKQLNYQLVNLQHILDEKTKDLKNSLSFIKATFNATAEGIITVNNNNKITSYNDVFIEQLNIPKALFAENNILNPTDYIEDYMQRDPEFSYFFDKIMQHSESSFEITTPKSKIIEVSKKDQLLDKQVIGKVFSFRDITSHKVLESQLLFQATHDSLTTLPNRVFLKNRVEQAILHATRHKQHLGLLLLDLNDFKQVNDTLGHACGDELLKAVSLRLKDNIRKVDIVARLGGDEFVVVITEIDNLEDIEKFAGQIIDSLGQPYYQINGNTLCVTASCGISFYPDHATTFDILLKNADVSLYRAKKLKRGSFQIFESTFNEGLEEVSKVTSALHLALKNKEFSLVYQPLIELESEIIIGFEALLRWNNPIFGDISPSKFIPMTEKTGLIISIGEWVFKEACCQLKRWHDQGFKKLMMSINISGYQLKQDDFVDVISKIISETEVSADSIELELTESSIMENIEESSSKIQQLKQLGISFSIDDFGTGYSNFSHLQYLPFDKIKIDKVFVDQILTKQTDCMVDSIIELSKKIGLTVLAEGVEYKEQVEYLKKYYCDQAQGYFYSYPISSIECTKILSNNTVKN